MEKYEKPTMEIELFGTVRTGLVDISTGYGVEPQSESESGDPF